jgi:DNA-binding CsgD family transcriptional regulator
VRLLAEATTAETDAEVSLLVHEAAEIADDQHLVGILLDAPTQLWTRFDLDRTSHPLLAEVRARLAGSAGRSPHPALTTREIEVLRLLPYETTAGGLADRLYISANTAKWHLANIYRKLEVGRQQEAVARAVGLGLIDETRTNS